eukprot:jgi/Tetstr1/457898/TSEL_044417.t1
MDLLCEDFTRLLDETVHTAKMIVLFIVQHDRVRQMFLRIKGPQGVGLRTFPGTRFGNACLMIPSVLSNQRHLRDVVDDASWVDISHNKDGSAEANREVFLDVVDTRSEWEDMQCAVNLLLPVSDALKFIEGNTTRVSFVYLIMLHIGNDLAQWNSGALDGVLLDSMRQIVEKKMLEARVVAPTQNISHKLADVHDFPAVKAFLENVDKEISDRNKLWVPET